MKGDNIRARKPYGLPPALHVGMYRSGACLFDFFDVCPGEARVDLALYAIQL